MDYLRNTDLMALTPGRHVVKGEELLAIVEHCAGRTRADAKLESHRRYIDIQLVLEGVDEMGWKPLVECVKPIADFDTARDIRFYNDAPSSWIVTPAGSFCIPDPSAAGASSGGPVAPGAEEPRPGPGSPGPLVLAGA